MKKKNFKVLKKKIWKKVSIKSFGKINYKRKIFINKIYSNIDKCHTVSALLASIEQGERQGVMKTSVAYDSK